MQENLCDNRPRILIVDDEEGARTALEFVLEEHYDTESVEDGLSALESLQEKSFHLVLLDVRMKGLDGLETLKRIREYDKAIGIIMVSAVNLAREAAVAVKYGAFDYITKPYEIEHLLSAVAGAIKEYSQDQQVSALKFRENDNPLSVREKEVLNWIKRGKSSSDISLILHIAERTVNFHIYNIMQKLEVVNRPQAVAEALQRGIIEFD